MYSIFTQSTVDAFLMSVQVVLALLTLYVLLVRGHGSSKDDPSAPAEAYLSSSHLLAITRFFLRTFDYLMDGLRKTRGGLFQFRVKLWTSSGMQPLKSCAAERALDISSTIPDLTEKIVRPDGWQCCAGGAFGDVFRCRYVNDDGVSEVAVKSFRVGFFADDLKLKSDTGKAACCMRRELGIWRRLSHPNIVPFLGITYGFGREGSVSLVSTWMPHGTLHKFLELHDDRLAVAHRLQLLLDIASGLEYLHSFPIIHGDLSSNNVLLDRNCNACLADFGCASLIGEQPEGLIYLRVCSAKPGTLRWVAPEHLSPNQEAVKHTIKSDIYSFGNVALFVLSGKYPWSEIQHDALVVLNLFQGGRPARPPERPISDQHWGLIERCWSSIPERPPAKDVVCSLRQFLGTYTPPSPLNVSVSSPRVR